MGIEEFLPSGKIRLDQQLKFTAEIDKMTGILRRTLLVDQSRRENDVIVTSDNVEGGYLAGKELLEQGCVRPVIVTSRRSVSCYEDRKKGFDRALDEAGIPAENRGVIRKA